MVASETPLAGAVQSGTERPPLGTLRRTRTTTPEQATGGRPVCTLLETFGSEVQRFFRLLVREPVPNRGRQDPGRG